MTGSFKGSQRFGSGSFLKESGKLGGSFGSPFVTQSPSPAKSGRLSGVNFRSHLTIKPGTNPSVCDIDPGNGTSPTNKASVASYVTFQGAPKEFSKENQTSRVGKPEVIEYDDPEIDNENDQFFQAPSGGEIHNDLFNQIPLEGLNWDNRVRLPSNDVEARLSLLNNENNLVEGVSR